MISTEISPITLTLQSFHQWSHLNIKNIRNFHQNICRRHHLNLKFHNRIGKGNNHNKNWSQENKLEINQEKPWIMRILLEKRNWKELDNTLNIPEVNYYSYLGIRIDQSLIIKNHSEKLKIAGRELRKRIGILKPSILNTKTDSLY